MKIRPAFSTWSYNRQTDRQKWHIHTPGKHNLPGGSNVFSSLGDTQRRLSPACLFSVSCVSHLIHTANWEGEPPLPGGRGKSMSGFRCHAYALHCNGLLFARARVQVGCYRNSTSRVKTNIDGISLMHASGTSVNERA